MGYIGMIESGLRGKRPNPDLTRRLAFAIAISLEEADPFFRAAGQLDEEESLFDGKRPSVIEAIERDRHLPESSPRILIDAYTLLRRPRPGSSRRIARSSGRVSLKKALP